MIKPVLVVCLPPCLLAILPYPESDFFLRSNLNDVGNRCPRQRRRYEGSHLLHSLQLYGQKLLLLSYCETCRPIHLTICPEPRGIRLEQYWSGLASVPFFYVF